MTESSASENKTSVVDDFFSALFANTNSSSEASNINNNSSDNSASSSRDATVTPIPTNSTSHDVEIKREAPEDAEEEPSVENDDQQGNHSQANEQQATPPVLDEFDEYSLLSKRRQSDSTSNLNSRARPNTEQPAQTLAKRHIDWSKVIPESRMLIHQLPKSTSKQELMDYFSKYGEVLEVVQKNTFGFVHFENPEQCARAVEAENYKTFNDVLLNLEICKRKPKFARVTENENRRRVQGHRGNNRQDASRSRSRSRSPPLPARTYNNNGNNYNSNNNNINNNNKRGNSDTRNGREPKVMNDYRNRQREYNGNSNRHDNGFDYERTNNYRPDYSQVNNDASNVPDVNNEYGRENNYRPDYARRNTSKNNGGKRVDPRASGYSYKAPTIISRNGGEVPAVQIISWNTDNALMNYINSLFTQKHIRTDARIFNYLNHSRGELVKQMVLEGVKAIVLIDSRNSEQGKVYLQVFAPVDHGDGVRYDEYDSVTPNEAVGIVQNTHPELRQAKPRYQPYTSPYDNTHREAYNPKPQYSATPQYSGPSYGRSSEASFTNTNSYQKPSYYNNPTRGSQFASPPVQQQQYQQPSYVTQSTYQQPQAISAPPPPVPNIDPNTLATIYSLIQSDTLSKIPPPAVSLPPTTATSAVAAAPTAQPSIPQLLATLVNSLGAAGMAHHTPPSASALLPTTTTATTTTTNTPEQPSMAALLSTATGGNPALAQLLLQQMTSGVTNSSSPTPRNAQASPTLVSQTNQPRQEYGYSSYGQQRN
ncbi:Superoxide dismutase [Mn], mitochondrial [Mucor velutinosus]|uniref:Superoxide dismutase [Mn], mitochondrial n=1 Tax=Mucor velutinosus TaxID=708070 RepID=A0AAN7DP68_9FUNG|nr:Superoxide dismutase [Mn], mitochondrial [Mucor velutinosus]